MMAFSVASSTASDALVDASAQAGVFRLLARIWLREVDGDFLRQLRAPPLCEAFAAAGGALPIDDDAETIELLAIDYCRLLIGPAQHLPPYQSVWEGGQFQTTITASMRQFIEVAGYDAGALPRGVMLDHLGVQLDVMGHILGQISAWPPGADGRDAVVDLAHSFFAAHLRWPHGLLEAAANRAATDFYRSSILLTRDFLNSQPPT